LPALQWAWHQVLNRAFPSSSCKTRLEDSNCHLARNLGAGTDVLGFRFGSDRQPGQHALVDGFLGGTWAEAIPGQQDLTGKAIDPGFKFGVGLAAGCHDHRGR